MTDEPTCETCVFWKEPDGDRHWRVSDLDVRDSATHERVTPQPFALRVCASPKVRMYERLRVWGQSVTHCKRGHEFTPENTRVITRGVGKYRVRQCRACEKLRSARRSA